jgi:hypothetical protein
MEHPTTGTASLPAWASSRLRPGHRSRHPKPLVYHQAHKGDEGAHSDREWCSLSPKNDRERHNLSLKEPGPQVFGGNMRNACVP